MASIVTYDIPAKHRELKKAMFELDYKDKIPGNKNCDVIYFPNTALYHSTKTPEEARDDVKSVCKSIGIDLERCIATIWEDWAVLCGEPFK